MFAGSRVRFTLLSVAKMAMPAGWLLMLCAFCCAQAVAGASFARLIDSDNSEAYRPPRDALVCAPGAHGAVCEL